MLCLTFIRIRVPGLDLSGRHLCADAAGRPVRPEAAHVAGDGAAGGAHSLLPSLPLAHLHLLQRPWGASGRPLSDSVPKGLLQVTP